MRVMVIVKATAETEAGVLPTGDELNAMGKYNDQLVKAGIMLAGEGLRPSSKGARVKLTQDGPVAVVDGPFAETKELVSGFWLWEVKSFDEAVEWAKRCPNPTKSDFELEVREVSEAEDFGDAFTPEMQAAEDKMRQTIAGQQH